MRTEAFDYQSKVADYVLTVFGFVGKLIQLTNVVKNLIIIAPMSAGKTRAAINAMEKATKACIVAQQRTLCEQHFDTLCKRFHRSLVAIATRDHAMDKKKFKDRPYRVLTIFKLLQFAITIPDFAEQCPLVVLDEIDDMGPWYQLAVSLLMKLHPKVRIIALTGTMHPDDIEPVKKWLNAEIIESEIRPYDLSYNKIRFKAVKNGETEMLLNGEVVRTIKGSVDSPQQASTYVNQYIRSLRETPIMFFSQRQYTANSTAAALLEDARKVGRKYEKLVDRASEIPFGETENRNIERLYNGLPYGIGIHHGNIPAPQQRMVEELSFGDLKAVSACYTLARGTDFPFTDVVFTSLWDTQQGENAPKLIRVSDVKQIAARCGRPDSKQSGNVWLLCFTDTDEEMAQFLIDEPASYMDFSLGSPSRFASVALGLIYRNRKSKNNLLAFLYQTLWGSSVPKDEVKDFLGVALGEIEASTDMVQHKGNEFILRTRGRQAARLGLHPMEFDVIDDYTFNKISFSEMVELLSQIYHMFEDQSVEDGYKTVIQHGLGVYRLRSRFVVRNFTDYVERTLERCEALMRLDEVPDQDLDNWRQNIYKPFVCGESRLATELYDVIGRKSMLSLVRMSGKSLMKQPGSLTPNELKNFARILYKRKRKPGIEDIQQVSTCLGITAQSWDDIITNVNSKKKEVTK